MWTPRGRIPRGCGRGEIAGIPEGNCASKVGPIAAPNSGNPKFRPTKTSPATVSPPITLADGRSRRKLTPARPEPDWLSRGGKIKTVEWSSLQRRTEPSSTIWLSPARITPSICGLFPIGTAASVRLDRWDQAGVLSGWAAWARLAVRARTGAARRPTRQQRPTNDPAAVLLGISASGADTTCPMRDRARSLRLDSSSSPGS